MIRCNVHVKTLAQITKDQAIQIVNGVSNGKVFVYFEDKITGTVDINYPLKNTDYFEVENEESIGSLLWGIAKRYVEIYKEEARTMNAVEDKTPLLNRIQTDGKYGIYGHYLGDLYFEGIEVDENNIIHLFMGS